ncbi:MAG: glycerophosphodiester phosphodiesterase, partial [Clostridia bacterium]|nr:glycerophosphodiester phosphodiesterase [Clostridia bacterium]
MKDFTWLMGHSFCHRGLHDNKEIPENSLAAFKKAKEKGFGMELDVYLTTDGKLIVHHDYTLKRSCGINVKAPKIDTSRLDDYKLMNTSER